MPSSEPSVLYYINSAKAIYIYIYMYLQFFAYSLQTNVFLVDSIYVYITE